MRPSENRAESQERRAAAIRRGAPRYVGMRCLHGHDGLRITSNGACVACHDERNRSATKLEYARLHMRALRAAKKTRAS